MRLDDYNERDIRQEQAKLDSIDQQHFLSPLEETPGYLIATANHQIPNGDLSVMDEKPLIHGLGGAVAGAIAGGEIGSALGLVGMLGGAIVGAATGYDWRFTAATVVSGTAQVANGVNTIANVLEGKDLEQGAIDPHSVMKSFDDNLDAYYTINQDSVDTAGFILGSLVPGIAGTKVFNYGSAALNAAVRGGQVGSNMASATGLLASMRAEQLALATETFKTTGQVFTYFNKNVIASLALGAGDQALQTMAFEAGVQAVMSQSPMLKEQDYGDIATNILHAGLYGGAIGGVIEGVGGIAGIKKALGKADLATRSHEWQAGVKAGTAFDEAYLTNVDSAIALPETPVAGLEEVSIRKAAQKSNSIDDANRRLLQEITTGKGDAVIANNFHELVGITGQSVLDKSKLILGLEELGRVNVIGATEKELGKLTKKAQEMIPLSEEELKLVNGKSVKFVQIWGDKKGTITDLAGVNAKTIWNQTKAGQAIQVTANNVQAGGKVYDIKLAQLHDSTKVTDIAAANAREIWAIKSPPLKSGQQIGEYDFALLRKAAKDLANSADTLTTEIKVIEANGGWSRTITSSQEALDILNENLPKAKQFLRERSLVVPAESVERLTDEEVAHILNVKLGWVDGTAVDIANPYNDTHAIQSYVKDHIDATTGKIKKAYRDEDILLHPQTTKAIYNTGKISDWEATALPIQVYIKQQQALLTEVADRAVAHVLGPTSEQFISSTELDMKQVTRNKIGGSAIAATNSDYGTQGSFFERIGHVVNKAKTELSNKIETAWTPVAYKILGETNTDSAIELSTLMNKIRTYPDRYVIDDITGGQGLILDEYAKYLRAAEAGESYTMKAKISIEAPDLIPIKSAKVMRLVEVHRDLNAARLAKFSTIRGVSGNGVVRSGEHIYFPPPDIREYKHFALITDPSITGTGHGKMIYAATEEKLEQMIALVPEEFKAGVVRAPKVKTKEDIERWHKAIGDFKNSEAMTDNYFDAALHKSGAASDYILKTDGKLIVDELKQWHIKQEHTMLREAVSLKYFKEFQELKNLGEREAGIRLSTFTSKSAAKFAKENTDNPYMSYIRTALDIPNSEQIPLRTTQDWADTQVSKVWDTFTDAFYNTKSPEELDKINKLVQDAGIKTINYDATNIALANHRIPKGALSTFTRRANAILASIILKPSVLNAVNNIVGMNVLLAPEMNYVINAIKTGDREAIGALADTAHVVIPGTEHSFLSTTKLITNAVKEFTGNPEARKWLLDRGISVRHSQEVSDVVDVLALTGREYELDLAGKISLAYDKAIRLGKQAEKITGNSYAEELTRGVSALIMKQLTDTAVKAGSMSPQVAETYIQTFVNRVNGNYLASQRPMMFNGPIGQSVGLFQTYMVTLIQQSMRHVAEGSGKSLALMLAAQGTIYGMNALPGFQQLNTNLVASFASNKDNNDVFSMIYRTMDKQAADWVMYGALSNSLGLLSPELKLNMYTRGDVNPRNVSVVPISPADYPISVASAKFFGNLVDMFDKGVMQQAPIATTFLQGLEHNGLSRELSGIAQFLEGFTNPQSRSYSTTSGGSLVQANDMFSLTSLVRLAGAKPLDEAIAQDLAFRQVAFKAKETDRMKAFGEGIKAKFIGTGELSDDDLLEMQRKYVSIGGKQDGFNKYITSLYVEANVALPNRVAKNYTEKMRRKLASPESYQMQLLMGGRPTDGDFYKPVASELGALSMAD